VIKWSRRAVQSLLWAFYGVASGGKRCGLEGQITEGFSFVRAAALFLFPGGGFSGTQAFIHQNPMRPTLTTVHRQAPALPPESNNRYVTH